MHMFSIIHKKVMRQCVLLHLQRLLFHYRNQSAAITHHQATVTSTNLDPLASLSSTCYDIHSLSGFPFIYKRSSLIQISVDLFRDSKSNPTLDPDSLLNTMRSKRDRALNSCFQNGVDPTANHTPSALLPITALLLFTTSRGGAACMVKLCAKQ